MARLLDRYKNEICSKLKEEFGYTNDLAIPKLEKIVVNMGIGEATSEPKRMQSAMKELAMITGQQPVITKARKSVAGFKLRLGNTIGCKVTLRGKRMYEFLDRLINIVMPRIRDFRGVSVNAFDERGNYNLGLKDQIVFPEIDIDSVEHTQGMDINIVVANSSKEESLALLTLFGMPFRRS